MLTQAPGESPLVVPPRFSSEFVSRLLLAAAIVIVLVSDAASMGVSPQRLLESLPKLLRFLAGMFPPDFSHWPMILRATWTTLRIALLGAAVGLAVSSGLAVLASRSQSPSAWVCRAVRSLLSAIRTIPELIWAILFVIAVGLGPLAGILAITFDTLGFAGRFFADALDDAPQAPQEALRSFGASRLQVLFGAVLPEALPALIGIALHSLERAIRASVILGVVGAGGIGIELMVAIKLFEYQRSLAIIISILVVVMDVETVSSLLRRHVQRTVAGRHAVS